MMFKFRKLYHVLAIVVALSVGVTTMPGAAVAQDGSTAIKVNGEKVTKAEINSQIDRSVKRMKRRFGKKMKGKFPEKRLRQRAKKRVVSRTVNRLVLRTNAEKNGVTVSDKEVDKQLGKTIDRFPSKKAFKAALKKQGMTTEQLRRKIRKSLVVQKFLSNRIGTVTVTDQQARSFYKKNKARFKGRSFGKVKARIKQMMKQRKKSRKQQELVSRLKKKSSVEVNV